MARPLYVVLLRSLLVVAYLVVFSSCSLNFWPFDGGKTSEPVSADDDAKPEKDAVTESKRKHPKKDFASTSAVSDVELKQARMWNRMDELEDDLKTQRERIKLLEQGLLTGIAPEELKRQPAPKQKKISVKEHGLDTPVVEAAPRKRPAKLTDEEAAMKPVLDLPDQVTAESGAESTASSPDGYKVRLQMAKDYYQASRFGMAVAELAQISREFGADIGDGEARYWLGRSYLGLKEYGTAKSELEGFIAAHPQSEYVPNARLELGRCLIGLNLRDRARNEFAKIAKEYEGQDPGDIAAAELRSLKGAL